jgi:hypothetical protein
MENPESQNQSDNPSGNGSNPPGNPSNSETSVENGNGEIEEKRKELEVAEFMCGIQQKNNKYGDAPDVQQTAIDSHHQRQAEQITGATPFHLQKVKMDQKTILISQPKETTNQNVTHIQQQPISGQNVQPIRIQNTQQVGTTVKVTQQLPTQQFVQFAPGPGVSSNQPITNQSISIGQGQPTQTIRIVNEADIQDPTIELVEINQIDEKNQNQYQVYQQH